MATISQKLLDRIKALPDFKSVPETAVVTRLNPSPAQVENGALKWALLDYNIGSVFTMKECLHAKNWDIYRTNTSVEIVPETQFIR
jgi:hypothetical protein